MITNEYYTAATDKTPEIKGNIQEGTLRIVGKSLPENAQLFFTSFKEWLGEFYKSKTTSIKVDFDLEYYNTSSSSMIIDILKNLKELQNSKSIEIKWLYEEDDLEMREIGEDFQDIIGEIVLLIPKTPSA